MPTAYFGTFSKRINSTKQFTGGTAHDVKFKNPVSRESPVLIVAGTNFPRWNYMRMYIGNDNDKKMWYYWINDIVSLDNGRFEIHAQLDPLATFKDAIKQTYGFINYGPASLNVYDIEVNDPRFTADVIHSVTYGEQTFDILDIVDDATAIGGRKLGDGCVVMRILSLNGDKDNPDISNGVSGIQTIVGSLDDYMQFIDEYAADVLTQLNNITGWERVFGYAQGYDAPFKAVKSAIWLPIPISKLQGASYTGDFGGYSVIGTWNFVKADAIKGAVIAESTANLSVNLDSNVQIYPWLKSSQYLSLILNTPGGTLDLSSNNKIFDYGYQINLRCRLLATLDGEFTLYVYAPITISGHTEYEIVGIQKWNCSTNLLDYLYQEPSPGLAGFKQGMKIGAAMMSLGSAYVSSQSIDTTGMSKDEIKAANLNQQKQVKAANLNSNIASGISGAVGSINMNDGSFTFSGAGNMTCLYANHNLIPVRLYAIQWKPEIFNGDNNSLDPSKYVDYCNKYGYPVFRYGNMNSHDGFYQMAGAFCQIDAPPAELASINSFINSGIWIED